MKILILGGYGVFGGRLARLISDLDVDVLIAGRDLLKAKAFCQDASGTARYIPVQLDRVDIAQALASHRPAIVVDASGPFQAYGDNPYSVPTACIDAGVDYFDLADGAEFVRGIETLDARARAAGIVILSGASTAPALTSAVVQEMSKQGEIVSLSAGIAPSPHAGVGQNVLRAVLGYAGAPVTVLSKGQWVSRAGLTGAKKVTIAPPGKVPLRRMRFSLVEVPDLKLLPKAYPSLQSVSFRAGPGPIFLHRMLNALAWLRAAKLLPSLAPLAPLAHRVLKLARFGEHRGGMFVEAKFKNGNRLGWHLIAEGDDGPNIPAIAVEVLIRNIVAGTPPQPGARPAVHAVSLAEYEARFARHEIFTGFRDDEASGVYPRVLGSDFASLPPLVQAIHRGDGDQSWVGQADVTRGSTWVARFVARLFGFPTKDLTVPARVDFDVSASGETWRRNFDGRRFQSHQAVGEGRDAHLIVERFGPVKVALAVVRNEKGLALVPRHWRLFGLPMPRALLPKGRFEETERDGRFWFDVDLHLPLVGRMVHYRGWLLPEGERLPD